MPTFTISKVLSIVAKTENGLKSYSTKLNQFEVEASNFNKLNLTGDNTLFIINKYSNKLEKLGFKKEIIFMNEYTDWSVKGVFCFNIKFTR